ncbi:MAG: tol-pal system protein YbgF [Desulfobacula sp.]|nr:tol-pal system protein YbgF [Desulfobacula sp.]
MVGLKNQINKIIFLLMLSFFFVSCGSINYFKKSPGNENQSNPQQIKISELESKIADIKQNQANLKLQMENKNKTIGELQDSVLKLKKKISFLEKNKTSAILVQKKKKHAGSSGLYKKAKNLLDEDNFKNAAALFTKFIKNHPQDNLTDNAAYWLGECHYSLGDYKKAIIKFKDIETKYPKSEKVPDAILKLGYSYLSLDDSNRAHHYLKKVLKKHPFSLAAEKAQEKLKSFE